MSAKTFIRWAESELRDLPTVALGKVSLVGLDWGTLVLVACVCLWKDTGESIPALKVWAAVLCALHGVSYANFRTAVQSPTTSPAGSQLPAPPDAP